MPPLKTLLRLFLPLITTTLFYGLYYLIGAMQFHVVISPRAVPFDLFLQLLIGYGLYALSRRLWVFVVLHGLLMAVLYIGNAVKISFFGGPIMPDDVYALRSLLLVLEGWRFMAAALPLAAIGALLLFNVTLKHWGSYLACLVTIWLGVTLVYQPHAILDPLDKHFWNSVWDQRSNYLARGATLYTLQEGARFFADADVPPERDAARTAAATLLAAAPPAPQPANKPGPAPKPAKPRNVHIILLESFWDPGALKKAGYNRAPLAREFRALWKQAGYSRAMSPVFGGYTANAEFEVLCGFPVVKDNVKFERQLLNDVPCLPHVLVQHGYRAYASHPNIPVFWNRVHAYRHVGFQTYWSQQDFVLDDMNREFLSDASLYRQVMDKLDAQFKSEQPMIDYIVTYFGHWNYPLSKNRPNLITSKSKVVEVSTYANTVYYKSLETAQFIERLRQRDPDSLIVLFGDHLPFMGENFAGYVDSGVLADKRSDFTPDMFKFYVSTPMIIIDGRNGPVKFGSLPIYQVPALLLKLLGISEPTLFDYTRPPEGMKVRPLPGLHFDLLDDGTVEVCKEPPYSPTCQRSAQWLENVLTVSNDLFIGQQFTRPGDGVRTP